MDIRILVAIDFGTTHSSFAYVYKENPKNVTVNCTWPGREGCFTVPTALQYDEDYNNVISWGHSALEEELDYSEDQRSRPIESFKLHLSNSQMKDKPWLPPQLDYRKVIVDYLTQMRTLIKEILEKRWPNIIFPQQVGFILTVPVEWNPHAIRIMSECVYKAGFLTSLNSNNLEFVTEPEALALYCLNAIKEHNLQSGDYFLVADCGDETVDLTTRKLLPGDKLSDITQRVSDLCGSTFIDKEFLQWLGRKVGFQALEKLKSKQRLVQRFFCTHIKFVFNGESTEHEPTDLDLQKYCPDLIQHVTGEFKKQMEDEDWLLEIDFHTAKGMFDPVINRVIKLISHQLKSSDEKCSAIFLVGGFSEIPYLIRRVNETFKYEVCTVAVPPSPIVATVRGATTYGLSIMTYERSKCDPSESLTPDDPCDSSENLASDEPHEIIGKLGIGFNKMNSRLTNLLEENQKLKQQCKNLQEGYQEILRVNLELNEQHQEILRVNSELMEERQEFSRINSELKEKLQEKDKKFENIRQCVLNLENQKNDDVQQLKIISRNLEKNLKILD